MEPARLVVGRRYRELHRGAYVVPNPIVVRRNHLERIVSRSHIRITCFPSRTDGLPLVVETVEPVAELDSFRNGQASGAVVDLKARRAHWEDDVLACVAILLVSAEKRPDCHWWGQCVSNELGCVDRDHP